MEVKRVLLFLIGCIGLRTFIVYLAKTQLKYLRVMGYLALLPAIGFFVIYFGGLRKTGAEVFGEKIWWNSLRPLHGFLWGLFAFMAIRGDVRAWIVLLVDVVIGLMAYLGHYFLGLF